MNTFHCHDRRKMYSTPSTKLIPSGLSLRIAITRLCLNDNYRNELYYSAVANTRKYRPPLSCRSKTKLRWQNGKMRLQYAISQLRFVRSGLHLVTYLDVGNFSEKSTETTLHAICVRIFLRFSDSSKPGQSVPMIYEFV